MASALAPTWETYVGLQLLNGVVATTFTGPAYALAVETVGAKYRLLQGFAFQWIIGYVLAGAIAYWTGNWRTNYLVVNGICLPVLAMFFLYQESPRWLIQKHKFGRAAEALNKMGRWNGRSCAFTAAQMRSLDVGESKRKRKYNALHLFSTKKLALYSLCQICTGLTINVVFTVILMNVQDLAGSPFLNVVLLGLLRLWTPFAAVLFDRYSAWFGRRILMLGSLGALFACFFAIILIYSAGLVGGWHTAATGFALLGYAISVSFVWVAYKQYTSELFPTVIRTIALGTFSFITLIGSAIGPQLILLKIYWFPAPYCGAAAVSALAFIMAFFILPETKGRPLPDTLEQLEKPKISNAEVRDLLSEARV